MSIRVLLIFAFLITCLVPGAYGEDGRIADLSVAFHEGEIQVNARLQKGFQESFKGDIHNGIQKDVFFYILLKRRQALWMDEEVISRTVKYTVKYDILKKQYLVKVRKEDNTIEQKVGEFDVLRNLISEIKNVNIGPVSFLDPDETYYVSVKAEMRATQLPFYLEYLLFFIPFLELDTPWADSSPFYGQ